MNEFNINELIIFRIEQYCCKKVPGRESLFVDDSYFDFFSCICIMLSLRQLFSQLLLLKSMHIEIVLSPVSIAKLFNTFKYCVCLSINIVKYCYAEIYSYL